MEVPPKKRKVNYIQLEELPLNNLDNIFNNLPLNELKKLTELNTVFKALISNFLKKRTYLYVTKQNENEISAANIARQFKEIAFHGNIKNENILRILNANKERANKISFLKNDLKFIKVKESELLEWLQNFKESLINLITINLELIVDASSNDKVTLLNLRKLSCSDEILSVLNAPNIEDVRIFSKDQLTSKSLRSINDFLKRHGSIKKFSYQIFCGDDDRYQNIEFNLNHLQLTELVIAEFRYSPSAILNILRDQKHLRKLHLEDGSFTGEDFNLTTKFEPFFEEIATMKYLNKLVIEMPTIKFLKQLKMIKSLKRLHVNAITLDVLEEFVATEYPNIEKLCIESIEGIESKKEPLKKENVWKIGRNFQNLRCLKFDIAPMSVVDAMIRHIENLKVVKIYHSKDTVKKFRTNQDENISLPSTGLKKIIFEQEDFRLRILPIIKVSPELRHVKIYWSQKITPVMTMIFEILESCDKIEEIEFKYNAVYAKENAIPFKSHFHFAYNNRNYQVILSRKNGKIRCVKL